MPSPAEAALRAFERRHRLRVTVHDADGDLAPLLAPGRHRHAHALCEAVKALGHRAACVAYDQRTVPAALAGMPDGRVHVCPAGLVELAVPSLRAGRVAWVLFAGPRLAGRDLAAARAPALPLRRAWAPDLKRPRPLGASEAQDLLECLRQLRARLAELVADHARAAPDAAPRGADRAAEIRAWVREHALKGGRLDDLARHLGIGRFRCAHAVRATCGSPLSRLLQDERLDRVAVLLRDTRLGVAAAARRCGFASRAHFHACWRRRHGVAPGSWRRRMDG